MRLTNNTSIDVATVRDVVRFVCPPGVTRFTLTVRDVPERYSRTTYYGAAEPTEQEWPVRVYIGGASLFPAPPETKGRGPGYLPDPWLADRVEALVFVVAHELRHLWQWRIPRGRRVWGARGRYSERDADAYALRMLRAWRRRDDLTEQDRRPYASRSTTATPRGRRAALPPMR